MRSETSVYHGAYLLGEMGVNKDHINQLIATEYARHGHNLTETNILLAGIAYMAQKIKALENQVDYLTNRPR